MPHSDPVKRAEYIAQWRAKNKEAQAQKQKERYEQNKEKILAQQKEMYQQDKERITERNRSYRQRNRAKINEHARQYRADNPDLIKEQTKRAYEKQKVTNFKGMLVASARGRAKQNGVEFTITEEDVDWNTHCPILDIELSFRVKGRRESAASLDRIDNSKGYVPGNVRLVSNRANRIKSDATIEELEKIVRYMKG